MPTFDIKVNYGATGDGQIATATVTLINVGSGNKDVVVATGIFAGGDVNKYISITGCGTGVWLNVHTTKIATVHSSTHITLLAAASNTLAASSQTIEWGNDDTPAFNAFRVANLNQTGLTLEIPAGRYCFVSGYNGAWPSDDGSIPFYGLGVHVLATGSPVVFSDLLSGGIIPTMGSTRECYVRDNGDLDGWSSLIATAEVGASYVQLLTPSEVSLFTVGKYVLIAGCDVQRSGQPINPQFYEYPIITAIDSTPASPTYGRITLNTPLKYRYDQNWVDWTISVPTGQPRIYVTNEDQITSSVPLLRGIWDRTQIYEGISFEFYNFSGGTFNQFSGRDITIIGGYSSGGQAPIPSCCYSYVIDGHDMSAGQKSEIDKITVYATYMNLTARGWSCQSPSPDLFTLENVTVTDQIDGIGKSVIFNNCIIQAPGSIVLGTSSYGSVADTGPTLTAIDTDFGTAQIVFGGGYEDNVTGIYTISNGTIIRQKFDGTFDAPPTWGAPGGWVFPASAAHGSAYGPVFQILNITESGGNIYITTTLPATGSSFPSGSFRLRGATAPTVSFTNCTGTQEALSYSDCTANKPLATRWNKRYDGNIASSLIADPISVLGKAISITFTVSNPAYGSGTLSWDFFAYCSQMSNASVKQWALSLDLTTPGTRTITYMPETDSYTVSSLGTDALDWPPTTPSLAVGAVWIWDDQMSPIMNGAPTPSTGKYVIITMETDQGFEEEEPASDVGVGFRSTSYGAAKFTSRPVKIPQV